MKRTPWYPAHIKPVRVGMYEIQVSGFVFSGYWWDGKRWLAGENSAYSLWTQTKLKWRGLTAPVGVSK